MNFLEALTNGAKAIAHSAGVATGIGPAIDSRNAEKAVRPGAIADALRDRQNIGGGMRTPITTNFQKKSYDPAVNIPTHRVDASLLSIFANGGMQPHGPSYEDQDSAQSIAQPLSYDNNQATLNSRFQQNGNFLPPQLTPNSGALQNGQFNSSQYLNNNLRVR